jgi:hypothetical protein
MKFAYLIIAHKNPDQFVSLVKRLDSEDSVFFIHIDKKADIEPFQAILKSVDPHKIVWVKRRNIVWAGFNMIRVVLDGFKEILKFEHSFSHVTFISGQDYPIKPVETYHQFLRANPNKDFIEYSKMPRPNWQSGGFDRILYHHFIFPKVRFAYPLVSYLHVKLRYKEGGKWDLFKKIVNILPKGKEFPRKFLPDTIPYEGSQWWTLSIDTVNFIVTFLNKNKQFYNYFKYTHVADEIFFQTLLLNHLGGKLKNVVNNNLRYIDWQNGSDGHPAILTSRDLEALKKSDQFFARKLDTNLDKDILHKIDEECLSINV